MFDYLTAALVIFGILYIAFIITAYRIMQRKSYDDIIRERDKPLTDFGTKNETKQ